MREVVRAQVAAAGHYSAAAFGAGLIFVSGQGPLDPSTGRPVEGDARAKVRQCLRNVEVALRAAGASLDDVVKTTVFLEDWADFPAVNEVYAEFFPKDPPARSTIQGMRPPGHRVAIEAIAEAPREGARSSPPRA